MVYYEKSTSNIGEKTVSQKVYPFVKSLPVAKFYYQGSHSHPIRRTVLVTESTPAFIRGYEVREGSITRPFAKAKVKSYTRNKIAVVGQCGRRLRKRVPADLHNSSTLVRLNLVSFVKEGA